MSNQIKLGIGIPGQEPSLGPLPDLGMPRVITARKLKVWINNSSLDPYVKEELIKKIDNYPANTMRHFYKNIREHISRINKEKRENQKKDKK